MTRFARARGSKSSNERVPDEATPWNVMKMQLADSQANTETVTKKAKSAKQLLAEKDEPFYHNNTGNVNHEWAAFDNVAEGKPQKNEAEKLKKNENSKKNKKKIEKAAKLLLSNSDSNNDKIVEIVKKVKHQKQDNGQIEGQIVKDDKVEISESLDNVESKKKRKKSLANEGSSEIELAKPVERKIGDGNNIDVLNSNVNSKDTLSDGKSDSKSKKRAKKAKKLKSGANTENKSENVTLEHKKNEKPDSANLHSDEKESNSSKLEGNSEKLSKRQKRNQKKQQKILNERNESKANVAEKEAQKEQNPEGFDVQGNDWSNEVKFGKQIRTLKVSTNTDNEAHQSKNPDEQREKLKGNKIDLETESKGKDGTSMNNSNDNPHDPKTRNDHGTQSKNNQKRKGGKNDKKEYKRRKPDEGVIKMIINGNDVEVVKYDGFPVKKEDADRLQELKKNMIIKGIPRSEINIAMKLERRKAEKALARERKRVCFHCRKSGHNLSDCPEIGRDEAGSGICFKCGSTEHTHFECKVVKGQEFRHASCFICREQGHIARQCPDNPKGLYPQGGGCKVCGDVTHLKKDCPDLMKEKEETTITADKIVGSQLESLQEDKIETKSENIDAKPKNKIIKF